MEFVDEVRWKFVQSKTPEVIDQQKEVASDLVVVKELLLECEKPAEEIRTFKSKKDGKVISVRIHHKCVPIPITRKISELRTEYQGSTIITDK